MSAHIPDRRTLKGYARAAAFGALTATYLPAYLAERRLTRQHAERARERWVRRWSSHLLHLFGIQVSLCESMPKVLVEARARKQGVLFVLNHRSAIDIGVCLSLFGGRMVSRADLSQWPLLGKAATEAGTLFVNRTDARSGAALIRLLRSALEAGDAVSIFPEGTTYAGDEVRPFHPGGFVAAAGLDVWVVPVGIAYQRGSEVAFVNQTFLQHLQQVSRAPATRVSVSVSTPIAARELRARELAALCFDAVGRHVALARTHVDGHVTAT